MATMKWPSLVVETGGSRSPSAGLAQMQGGPNASRPKRNHCWDQSDFGGASTVMRGGVCLTVMDGTVLLARWGNCCVHGILMLKLMRVCLIVTL